MTSRVVKLGYRPKPSDFDRMLLRKTASGYWHLEVPLPDWTWIGLTFHCFSEAQRAINNRWELHKMVVDSDGIFGYYDSTVRA